MRTRFVVCSERQEALIESLVTSGRYQNASEVLCDGLRFVEKREAEEAAKREALRAAARRGNAAIDRGDAKRFDAPARLAAHLDALGSTAIAKANCG